MLQAKTHRELDTAESAKSAAEEQKELLETRWRREASEQRSEMDHLKVELEGAAQLAEQQNALVLTLESRLENVGADKQLIDSRYMLLTSEVQQHRTDINLVLREIGPILTGVLHERTGSEKSGGINLDQHFFPLEEFSERTPLPEVTQKVATTLRGLSAVVHQLEGTKVALRACKGSVDRLQGVVRSLEIANQVTQRENQSLRHQLFGQTSNSNVSISTPSDGVIQKHRHELSRLQDNYLGHSKIEEPTMREVGSIAAGTKHQSV